MLVYSEDVMHAGADGNQVAGTLVRVTEIYDDMIRGLVIEETDEGENILDDDLTLQADTLKLFKEI